MEKQDAAAQRKRKQELADRTRTASTNAGGASAASRASEERLKKGAASTLAKSPAMSTMQLEVDTKRGMEGTSSPSPHKTFGANFSLTDLRDPSRFESNAILRRAGVDADIDSISDDLLRENVLEHSALQETRLGLLRRIDATKTKSMEMEKKALQLEKKIADIVPALLESMAKPNPDWNLHIKKKGDKVEELRTEIGKLKDRKKLSQVTGMLIFVCILV